MRRRRHGPTVRHRHGRRGLRERPCCCFTRSAAASRRCAAGRRRAAAATLSASRFFRVAPPSCHRGVFRHANETIFCSQPGVGGWEEFWARNKNGSGVNECIILARPVFDPRPWYPRGSGYIPGQVGCNQTRPTREPTLSN
jgi:hypothetical protein